MSLSLSVSASDRQTWLEGSGPAVFQTPAWLQHWRTHYQHRGDRFVARSDALLPLYIRRQWLRPGVPVRTLRFAGTGDAEPEELCPEFCDLSDGVLQPAPADTWSALGRLPWDLCRFDNCMRGSSVENLARHAGGFSQPCGVRYSLPLPATLDDWLAGLSDSFRSKVRRTRQRMTREQMHLHIARAPAERLAALPALVSLHQSRWRQRGEAGVFSARRFLDFHQSVLADPSVPARLALLYRDDEVVAAWYGFDFNGTRLFYQSGMDGAQSGFSPGIALHVSMIEDAIDSGIREYDFMKGEPGSWKARFGCRQTPVSHLLVPATHLYGRTLRSLLSRSRSWQALEAGA
jgi:CelD/BcsL family acetyltransferase involved in cellulose biosynthesis